MADGKVVGLDIGTSMIRMVPPLIINEADCDKAVVIVKEAVESLEN